MIEVPLMSSTAGLENTSYSVVTACKNSNRTIVRTIESVLRQTVLPREYFFVDGGSTDGTLETIQDCITAAKTAGVTTVFQVLGQGAETGITSAWNLGLKECSSELVFILNSDDWYEPDCATSVIAAMDANPQVEIVFANARTFTRGAKQPTGLLRNRPLWLLPVLMPFVHPACFVRLSLYKRIGLYSCDYAYAADYDFLYRCHTARVGMKFLDQALVNFELGGAANSHRADARLELFRISRQQGKSWVLPLLALWARRLLGR